MQLDKFSTSDCALLLGFLYVTASASFILHIRHATNNPNQDSSCPSSTSALTLCLFASLIPRSCSKSELAA